MFKFLKFGKSKNADEIIGDLKKTEQNFIDSVNAELIKMNAVNQAMYEVCPEKAERKVGYIGCTACGECNKLKGVI